MYPELFEQWPDVKTKLLKQLGGDHSHLTKYHDLTRAMFKDDDPDQIPDGISVIPEEPSNENKLTTQYGATRVDGLAASLSKMKVSEPPKQFDTATQLMQEASLN